MKLKIFLYTILAIFFGILTLNYFLEHTECVPIKVSLFRLQDYSLREYIKTAMHNIASNSPEDFDRICNRATAIRLTQFDNQAVPNVPDDALGTYAPDQNDISQRGIINIDRDAPLGFKSKLESVLVHEACHAYQIQTLGDFSEPVCYGRGQAYLLSRPKDSLSEQSAEFIEQTGKQFYAYCSTKTQQSTEGECVFINYTTQNKSMCANIFLTKNGAKSAEQNICADVAAVGYKSIPFTLPINNRDAYRFDFSPSGF